MAEDIKGKSENEQGFPVKPTSPVKKESKLYSDIALTNLAREHAAQVSSVRQVVWQAYSTMLIANSIVFGFMTTPDREFHEVLFGVSFGIPLCIIWLILTKSGFYAYLERVKSSYAFSWPKIAGEDKSNQANPFWVLKKIEGGEFKQGIVYRMAIMVIILFMVAYLTFLIHSYIVPPSPPYYPLYYRPF